MTPFFLCRRFVFAAALAAIFLSAFVASAAPAGGRVTLTRETLQDAALTRLSDILGLIDDWNLSTTDGYTWKALPNGLSTYQEQHWIVMLDGLRVDLDLFDAVNLNMLPVTLDQIDSVVVVNTPQLHNGEFTDRGLIHFYTRHLRRGETYETLLMGGGETGDPGPYRYTRYKTANVDADGPDGSVTFGLARKNWQLYTSALVQHFYFSDSAIRPRTTDVLGTITDKTVAAGTPGRSEAGGISRIFNTGSDDTWPGMLRYGASAGMSYRSASGFHHPFVGYSKAQKYYLYSEPFGREMPTDNTYFHAGVSGDFYLAPKMTLSYRVRYSSNRLSRHENNLGFNYDWDARRAGVSAWFTSAGSPVGFELGAGLDEAWIKTVDLLEDEDQYAGRVYGSINISPAHQHTHRIGLMAKFVGAAPSLKAFWNWAYEINRRQGLETAFSFTQRDFAENNDLWYWTSKGYQVLDDNGVTYTMPDEINKSNTATADVTWRVRIGDKFGAGTTGLYRYFSDIYLEQRSFALNTNNCALTSPTKIIKGLGGQAIGGRVQITYEPSPRFTGRAYFGYLENFSGDDLLEQEWRTVPERKATVQLTYKPFDDFSTWVRMTHLSSTSWKAYEPVTDLVCAAGVNSVRYSPEISSSTILDLKLRKLLLNSKLAADLICRNVWDAENRYHPVGASFDLSFFLVLDFRYHSD